MHRIYSGAAMRITVLLLHSSAYLPHICKEKILLTWLNMPRPMISASGRPMDFIIYTEKNGVATFNAKAQRELNTKSFLKFLSFKGLVNNRHKRSSVR